MLLRLAEAAVVGVVVAASVVVVVVVVVVAVVVTGSKGCTQTEYRKKIQAVNFRKNLLKFISVKLSKKSFH